MLKDTVTPENVNTLVQGATSVQIVILVFLGIIACGVIFFLVKWVIDLKVGTLPQDIKEIKDSLNENKLKMAQMESKLWSHDDMAREIASAINQPEDFKNQTNKLGVFSMIKKLFVAIAVVFFIAGCSHNSVQYSDGLGFETTFRPDSGNFGFVFRYGKILSAVLRENSEVEMTGDGQGGSTGENAASASSSGSVKVKIGKQITGYYVDAINAGASEEKLNKYLDSGNDRKSDENKNQELEVKDGEL